MMKERNKNHKEEVPVNGDGNFPLSDIPWLNIIQFHREVVKQAEDQFFALDGGNSNHSRWTSLRRCL